MPGKVFGKKTRKITAPRPLGRRVERIEVPFGVVFRAFILGAVAIVGCLWAIWRQSHMTPSPLHRASPAASSSAHPNEIEIDPQ